MDYKQIFTTLSKAGKISQEDAEGLLLPQMSNLLPSIFETQFKHLYEEIAFQVEFEEKASKCWETDFKPDPLPEDKVERSRAVKDMRTEIKSLLGHLDKHAFQPTAKTIILNAGKEDEEKIKATGVIVPYEILPYLNGLIQADKERFEAEWLEEHKPKVKKNIKKSGETAPKKSRKVWTEDEIRRKPEGEVGSKSKPQGHDYAFCFKGDEDEVIQKDSFVAPDKSYKCVQWKAIKSLNYMGGEKSSEGDGICEGAVIWDRASGSKAVLGTGISPAKFRIRCSNKAEVNGRCKGCQKNPDFFTDFYNLGAKAKGNQHNGTTYCEFITKNLPYVD